MDEDKPLSEEEVIDEFMGENPRARELRLMRASLEQRKNGLAKEIAQATEEAERARLAQKIKVLDRQIEALRQEEAITEFVENSVRVTLSKATLEDED